MKAKTNFTQEIIRKRLEQADEMSKIWEDSTKDIQMYLAGCIATAAALSQQLDGPKKAG